MSLDVVCFLWQQEGYRTKYTVEHVNRLHKMVSRNSTVKHRFVCVTNTPEGLEQGIHVVPLWDNPMPTYGGGKRPNCFVRLKMFSEEAKKLFSDRIIWMDLDCLVLGNIDHILKEPADFKIWYVDGEISLCNGSLVAHKLGTRTHLWDKFDPTKVDPDDGYRNTTGHIGSDQAWIAQNLRPDDLKFGKADGVYSYRCHLKGKPLPPDTRIVFMHGDDKAEDLLQVGWIRRALRDLDMPDVPAGTKRDVPRDKLRVVTWLWKPPYGVKPDFGPEQVNILASMVDRYYRKPYEMVCVTEDSRGIDGSVRCIEAWNDFSYLPHPQLGEGVSTCYRRLRMFSPEMADIIAPRFVSLDLDVVFLADVSPLWERREDYVGWDTGFDWAPYNGSMTLMTAGARKQVWEKFDPKNTPQEAKDAGFVGTDQAAVAYILGTGEATWSKKQGVYAFRDLGYTGERESERRRRERESERAARRDRGREHEERESRRAARAAARKALPDNCRIVFFPGPLKPWSPTTFNDFAWVRKTYRDQSKEKGDG